MTKKKAVTKIVEPVIAPPKGPNCADGRYINEAKIVVVVAETVTWLDRDFTEKRFKLPCGMAAAQAAHAVSKLKFEYTMLVEQRDGRADYNEVIRSLMQEGITTIVLKARDSRELRHIKDVANLKNALAVSFYDTNAKLYGDKNTQVLTAVAVGPTFDSWFTGITDYLPLWKCNCDPQD